MRRLTSILFGLSLTACAAAPTGGGGSPASQQPLAGTRWIGVVDASTDRGAVPRLEFVREGRLSGFTGCNLMSGSWSEAGGKVTFGPIASTKRGCMGPGGEIEKRVLAAFGEQASAARQGERLVVSGPGGARFEFVQAPPGY